MSKRRDLLEPILASYREMGGINHLDCANLPSKRAISQLCDDLLHLLFPGFFSDEAVSTEELPEAAQEIIDQVADRLESEIAVSLRMRGNPGRAVQPGMQRHHRNDSSAVPGQGSSTDVGGLCRRPRSAQPRETCWRIRARGRRDQRSAHLLYREDAAHPAR